MNETTGHVVFRIIVVNLLVVFFFGCTSTVSYVRPSSLASSGKYDKGNGQTSFHKKKDTKITIHSKIQKSVASVVSQSHGGCVTRLKERAESYIGVKYKYGGTTRKGMDCSGFVWRVYTDIGFEKFKRTSASRMYSESIKVSRNDYRIGDLVFFRNWGRINHVGLYMGNGRFIHASSSAGVMYSKLSEPYFKKRFAGMRRRIKCQ